MTRTSWRVRYNLERIAAKGQSKDKKGTDKKDKKGPDKIDKKGPDKIKNTVFERSQRYSIDPKHLQIVRQYKHSVKDFVEALTNPEVHAQPMLDLLRDRPLGSPKVDFLEYAKLIKRGVTEDQLHTLVVGATPAELRNGIDSNLRYPVSLSQISSILDAKSPEDPKEENQRWIFDRLRDHIALLRKIVRTPNIKVDTSLPQLHEGLARAYELDIDPEDVIKTLREKHYIDKNTFNNFGVEEPTENTSSPSGNTTKQDPAKPKTREEIDPRLLDQENLRRLTSHGIPPDEIMDAYHQGVMGSDSNYTTLRLTGRSHPDALAESRRLLGLT